MSRFAVDYPLFHANLSWMKSLLPRKGALIQVETSEDFLLLVGSFEGQKIFVRQLADIEEPFSPFVLSLKDLTALLSLSGDTLEVSLEGQRVFCEAESSYSFDFVAGEVLPPWPAPAQQGVSVSAEVLNSLKMPLRRNLGLKSQAGGSSYSQLYVEIRDRKLVLSASNRFTLVRCYLGVEGEHDDWWGAIREVALLGVGGKDVIRLEGGEGVLVVRVGEDACVVVEAPQNRHYQDYRSLERSKLVEGQRVRFKLKELKEAVERASKTNPQRLKLKFVGGVASVESDGFSVPLRFTEGIREDEFYLFSPDTFKRALVSAKTESIEVVFPHKDEKTLRLSYFTQKNDVAKVFVETFFVNQTPREENV